MQVQSLGWEDPLEKEMAIHSNILDWKIPCTEEPGRLQPTGLQRVDASEQLSTHTDARNDLKSKQILQWMTLKQQAVLRNCRNMPQLKKIK